MSCQCKLWSFWCVRLIGYHKNTVLSHIIGNNTRAYLLCFRNLIGCIMVWHASPQSAVDCGLKPWSVKKQFLYSYSKTGQSEQCIQYIQSCDWRNLESTSRKLVFKSFMTERSGVTISWCINGTNCEVLNSQIYFKQFENQWYERLA